MEIVSKITDKSRWEHLRKTLRFSLHCLASPFDAFWDINHEKRGSKSAATVILTATILLRILELRYTSFLFVKVWWNYFNLFSEIATILLPLLIYVLGNWCLTTLFDGKGTMGDIYMGTCYALTPYVIIKAPLIIISNFVTEEEGVFYAYFGAFALIWCGLLIIASVMMIHDFSLGKALLMLFFSIIAMLVIIFLIILFFSLISDAIMYFYSIYKEVVFRLY